MNSAGVTPQNVHQKWQFGVEIAGMDPKFFLKADFPSFDIDEVEHNPAGSLFAQKTAGRVKFKDVTLEKSVPAQNVEESILDWARKCITVAAGTGGIPSDYMKDVDLIKYDRTGKEIKRYRLFNAWVKSAEFGEGEGSSSDVDMEKMTLCYQYFDRV